MDITALFGTTQMQWIVILIVIDVVLGIIAAIVKRALLFGELANFMKGPILAYVLGFTVVEIIGQTLPKLAFVVPGAFILIIIALLASILKNLGRLGLPLPAILKK